MKIDRRISATFKDVPGGQVLGPTFDYTHRLIDFKLAADGGGVPESESAEVLTELFDRVDQPEVRYSHKWRLRDLVLWDNRRTQHGRSDFNPSERRLLRRFAVFCETRPRPFDPACGPAPQEMESA